MQQHRVAAVGDNTIDRYPAESVFVGGNALNVAVQLGPLGVRAAYFGAIGADGDGRLIADTLLSHGVDTAGLVIAPGHTAVTVIRLNADGDRVFEHEDFGVTASYSPSDADLHRIAEQDWVHIGMLPKATAVVSRLRTLNPQITISQDCAVSSGFAGIDVAFCSAGEDEQNAQRIGEEALRGGAVLAVVTRGAAGVLASDGRDHWQCDALPIDVVDTTGAGDSFIAGFIAARLARASMPSALAAGAQVAARTCGHMGGFQQ